jgi:hypothetical protein
MPAGPSRPPRWLPVVDNYAGEVRAVQPGGVEDVDGELAAPDEAICRRVQARQIRRHDAPPSVTAIVKMELQGNHRRDARGTLTRTHGPQVLRPGTLMSMSARGEVREPLALHCEAASAVR